MTEMNKLEAIKVELTINRNILANPMPRDEASEKPFTSFLEDEGVCNKGVCAKSSSCCLPDYTSFRYRLRELVRSLISISLSVDKFGENVRWLFDLFENTIPNEEISNLIFESHSSNCNLLGPSTLTTILNEEGFDPNSFMNFFLRENSLETALQVAINNQNSKNIKILKLIVGQFLLQAAGRNELQEAKEYLSTEITNPVLSEFISVYGRLNGEISRTEATSNLYRQFGGALSEFSPKGREK